MGLQEVIRSGVTSGFAALDNLVQPCCYVKPPGSSNYDAESGEVTGQPIRVETKAIFVRFSVMEMKDEAVEPTDEKILINRGDLAARPIIDAQIEKADGTLLTIHRVQIDPAGAMWVLQGREP